ncbi:unnamed protein product [Mytilus coruscus]|uniref:Vertnin n=1 Tax=Mytilus coruscus TaxID=42192 RepID=A0A6J8DYV9_MYTCO|nr:unnamed protein product [Mytilus coruscus]
MVLLYLQSSESFDDLQAKCIEINESQMFHSYPFTVDKDIAIVTHNLAADRQAIDCMPRDGLALFSSMLPVCVVGDGNCLPRSASVACFGNETAHKEIRARIVVEMCLYKHQYVDNEYLNKGVDLPQKEAKNLVKTYAMFSEKYTPGDKITNEVISRIYDAEVSEIVKCGIFMGIWQLFALSSCANTRMYSVYPDLGAQLPRLTLNRQILPRNNLIQSSSKETSFVIMWSSTRTDMTRHNWVPNHFVPLIPSYHLKTPEVDIDFLQDGDEAFSLDDSVMMTLLQTVTDVEFDDNNDVVSDKNTDINTTTGDKPHDINGTTDGEPQDINGSTVGETQDINGTTGDEPLEINGTTCGESQDINDTNGGKPQDINDTTCGETQDIYGTTGDKPQDINYTTDGEPQDINGTTNLNISGATDGVPQDIICITDGEPKTSTAQLLDRPKHQWRYFSGDITGINGALGDEFQDTNDTTGDEPKDIKGTTDDKPQDINGTTDGENQNINGATDGESHIINSSPGDESQDTNATTGNEPRDINATTDTNGTTGVELQDINGTTVDEPQDINVTPVDEPKVITATTGDEPQDINGTIVDEPKVTTATTGDEPQDINDTTDEHHKCINGLTHDENTGINGTISDEHKTFNCRKEDDQHRLQNGHGSSFIQKRVQLIRHVLGG